MEPARSAVAAAVLRMWGSSSWAQLGLAVLALPALLMALRRTFCESRRRVHAPPMRGWRTHRAEAQRVLEQFRHFLAHRASGAMVSLNRSRGGEADSNRTIASDYKRQALKVDVSRLDGVIAVDRCRMLLHIEPGLPMDELARIAIAHGVLPTVVLEFPGITAGGAVAGGGIESSSHKHGSFFDTVEELDAITGDGRFLRGVSRTHEAELFYALSASYGTQAIVTRLAVRVEAAPRFVYVRYVHCDGMESATLCMERLANCGGDSGAQAPAFIDGVAMAADSAVVVVADGCDAPPPGVSMLSLRAGRADPWFFWHLATLARALPAVTLRKVAAEAGGGGAGGFAGDGSAALGRLSGHGECVPLEDYLFRFDRGAFWMARHGLQVFFGDAAFGRDPAAPAGPAWPLRVMYSWLASTRQLYRMLHKIGDEGLARTYVVQDLVMPGREEACALARFTGDASADAAGPGAGCLNIWPLWICPVRMVRARQAADAGFGFPVQRTPARGLMVNVGVYGLPNGGRAFDPVLLNRALEVRASALGGRKMLYAQSFYGADEFWALFGRAAYEHARARFGGAGVFPCISTKLLLGERRLASMRGRKPISFWPVLRPMASWYCSLWMEMLLPRALHEALGIHFTGMTLYEREDVGKGGGEDADTDAGVGEEAQAGAVAGAGAVPAAPAARRRRAGSVAR